MNSLLKPTAEQKVLTKVSVWTRFTKVTWPIPMYRQSVIEDVRGSRSVHDDILQFYRVQKGSFAGKKYISLARVFNST